MKRIVAKLSKEDVADEDEDWKQILPCYLLLLDIFTKLFGFAELYEKEKESYLIEVLKQIQQEQEQKRPVQQNRNGNNNSENLTQLLAEIFKAFFEQYEIVKSMSSAICLSTLLNTLLTRFHEVHPNLAFKFSEKCHTILRDGFKEPRYKNEHVGLLLNWYFKWNRITGDCLEEISTLLPRFAGQKQNEISNLFELGHPLTI